MQETLPTFEEKGSQTYKRNWSLYNMAQTREKILALRLLNDAVNSLGIPYEYSGRGRPPLGFDDMIKCCVIKVFNCFSSRRTIPDLELCKAMGYIRDVPHFNIISKYMRSEEMTEYLHRIYEMLAAPMKSVENVFAVDATGFGSFRKSWVMTKRWFCPQPVRERRKDFKKLHIVTGVRTNIITSAEASIGTSHDSPFFADMIKETAKKFDIKHVCADSAYLSSQNCETVVEAGGTPFIRPKCNNVPDRAIIDYKNGKKRTPWREMIWFWATNRKLFEKHYHLRSNVESSFSMMKRKFLPYIRSKDEQAQFNELLCKVVCHNLGVLITAIFELDLVADFNAAAAV